MDFAGGILGQTIVDIVGNFSDVQFIGSFGENAGNVEADVANADYCNGLGGEVPVASELWVGVVKTNEFASAVVLREIGPWDIQVTVAGSASGEDDGVVELTQFIDADLLADVNVSEQPDLRLVQYAVQGLNDALDSRVVGGNAVANQAEWNWEAFVKIDGDIAAGLHEGIGGVDAGWPRTDYGYAQWCGGLGEVRQRGSGCVLGCSLVVGYLVVGH